MGNKPDVDDINHIVFRALMNYTEFIGTPKVIFLSPQVHYRLMFNCKLQNLWLFEPAFLNGNNATMLGGKVKVVVMKSRVVKGFRISDTGTRKVRQFREPILNVKDTDNACNRLIHQKSY